MYSPNCSPIGANQERRPIVSDILTTDSPCTHTILNFGNLEYMNSSGIGLLVTLLIRAQRGKQKLLACGLSEHYRQIFQLTRLDEAIGIFASESEAAGTV